MESNEPMEVPETSNFEEHFNLEGIP